MEAAMARAISVLPEVASISVSPGLMSPRASARMIIDSAGRSFTEPAGLLPSSLARMTLPRLSFSAPGMRTRRTNGVFPTKSCRVLYIAMQPLDILGDAFLNRGHRRFVAGFTQLGQITLRESLVLALQLLGKGDVFEQTLCPKFSQRQRGLALGLAAAIGGSDGDIVEALRTAGTEVEDAGFLRVIEEEQIHLGDVADEDKIAHLAAVLVTMRAFEQLDLALGLELVVGVKGYGGHAPLVRFARTIDVEVTEADDLRRRVLFKALTDDLVE